MEFLQAFAHFHHQLLINVKIFTLILIWHAVWITLLINQYLNNMKRIMIITALAIVCQVVTVNAQCCRGHRGWGPRIGICIGIPVPVIIPPLGYYGYGYAHPYYCERPHRMDWREGREYRGEHEGHYGHRR